jgi:hypothetical protein
MFRWITGTAGALALVAGAAAAPAGAVIPVSTSSPTYAGYETSGDLTAFAGSLTVPTVNCASVPGSLIDDIGFSTSGYGGLGGDIAVVLDCESGSYSVRATLTEGSVEQRFVPYTISPGDVLSLRILSDDTTDVVTTAIKDVTTGQSYSIANDLGPQTNEFGYAVFGASPPILDFGKLVWTGVTVDGAPLGNGPVTAYRLINPSNGNKLLVATSPLNGAGKGWTSVFKASY